MIGNADNNMKKFGAVFVMALIITVVAILFGRADQGVIDVSATISNSSVNMVQNEDGSEGEKISEPISRVLSTMPNGGLVGTGKPEPQLKPEPEENASSTDETASTTGDGVEEEEDEKGEIETEALEEITSETNGDE